MDADFEGLVRLDVTVLWIWIHYSYPCVIHCYKIVLAKIVGYLVTQQSNHKQDRWFLETKHPPVGKPIFDCHLPHRIHLYCCHESHFHCILLET